MPYYKVVRLFTCFLATIVLATAAQGMEMNLLPQPQKLEARSGAMSLRDGVTVRYAGVQDERITRAVARLYDRLSDKLGFVVMQQPIVSTAPTLQISCESKGEKVQRAQEDESYSLTVDANGAVLRAANPLGVLRGLETFYQLAGSTDDGFGSLPAVNVSDRPRFAWRGLLLDVARHYMPVEQIEREIDGLAAVKMNVLHLHLSDDQSFRIESKKFPQLVNKSSHGQYYTRADIKGLVAYAQDRGVRIIPEFDVPGHSTAWLASFPELAVSPADGSESFVRFGGYKNTLDPSNPKVLKILDKLFGEMASLFPDEYFHIGGDEVDYSYWKVSSSVAKLKQQRKLADEQAVQTYFNTQIEKILHKHGKKMVGWNEILHADLPKTTVVHSWTGVGALQEAVTRGYPVICSLDYYLDWYMPASFHYGIDPLRPNPETFETLMKVVPGGSKSKGLQQQKAQAEAFHASPEAERLVLGGEAAQWSELVAPWTIDTVLWPRLAAIAERLWSPAEVTDLPSLYRRLDGLKLELSDLGIAPDEDFRKLRLRLAGSEQAAQTLAEFTETLEPVKYYTRNVRQKEAKSYNLNSPLNRLVDTVPAESEQARQFAAGVTVYLNGRKPEDLAYLRAALARWEAAAQKMADLAKTNPRLSEALPLVDSLRAAYKSAAEALDYLESGKQAPSSWTELQRVALNPEGKNDSDLKPAITLDLQRLIGAATAQSGNSDVRASSRQ